MRTDVIDATIASWTDAPHLGRSAPTVSARAEGSQAVITAGPFTWRADLPEALGGSNTAPSPTALLLGALAGCAVAFVRDVLAPQLGIVVDGVDATVSCETDARGLLGLEGAEPDLRRLRLDVAVKSPNPEAIGALAEAWTARCPVLLALIKATAVDVDFHTA